MADLLLYIPWGRGNLPWQVWTALVAGAVTFWLIDKYYEHHNKNDE